MMKGEKKDNRREASGRPHRCFLLVGWVLWHINICSLVNAKSIFMQIVSSISNNSV